MFRWLRHIFRPPTVEEISRQYRPYRLYHPTNTTIEGSITVSHSFDRFGYNEWDTSDGKPLIALDSEEHP